MIELLSCARGHFWEGNGGEAARCPECGVAAESLPLIDLAPADAPPPAPAGPAPLLDGAGAPVVAGYKVLEDLGRGPTGARLYRAEQTAARRDVLLSVVLAREDASQQAWGALRGEAAA